MSGKIKMDLVVRKNNVKNKVDRNEEKKNTVNFVSMQQKNQLL